MLDLILGYFLVLTGIAGSGLAGYIDLKTTEIPDEIPLAMVVIGLLTRFSYSAFSGSWNFLILPGLIGGGFFLFGLFMYYSGQWGGGDAKVLGAMGILMGTLPQGILSQSPFPVFLNILTNMFFVGAVYIMVYALAISLGNKKIIRGFWKSLKGGAAEFALFMAALLSVVGLNAFLWNGLGIFNPWFTAGAVVFGTAIYPLWKFLRCVEKIGFMKKISSRDLREGDMIGEDIKKLGLSKKIIRGLTAEEVRKIKKLKKTVWIREGVRFGPVFPMTIIVTLLFGNLLFFVL